MSVFLRWTLFPVLALVIYQLILFFSAKTFIVHKIGVVLITGASFYA